MNTLTVEAPRIFVRRRKVNRHVIVGDTGWMIATMGYVAALDADDLDAALEEAPWRTHKQKKSLTPYIRAASGVLLHRHTLGVGQGGRLILGESPNNFVDHINGYGVDNRRANLRKQTHQEGQETRFGWFRGNLPELAELDQLSDLFETRAELELALSLITHPPKGGVA